MSLLSLIFLEEGLLIELIELILFHNFLTGWKKLIMF